MNNSKIKMMTPEEIKADLTEWIKNNVTDRKVFKEFKVVKGVRDSDFNHYSLTFLFSFGDPNDKRLTIVEPGCIDGVATLVMEDDKGNVWRVTDGINVEYYVNNAIQEKDLFISLLNKLPSEFKWIQTVIYGKHTILSDHGIGSYITLYNHITGNKLLRYSVNGTWHVTNKKRLIVAEILESYLQATRSLVDVLPDKTLIYITNENVLYTIYVNNDSLSDKRYINIHDGKNFYLVNNALLKGFKRNINKLYSTRFNSHFSYAPLGWADEDYENNFNAVFENVKIDLLSNKDNAVNIEDNKKWEYQAIAAIEKTHSEWLKQWIKKSETMIIETFNKLEKELLFKEKLTLDTFDNEVAEENLSERLRATQEEYEADKDWEERDKELTEFDNEYERSCYELEKDLYEGDQ